MLTTKRTVSDTSGTFAETLEGSMAVRQHQIHTVIAGTDVVIDS